MTRAPIDMMLDGATWRPVEHREPRDGIPVVTHTGTLRLAPDLEITVHQLSDGQRVIPEDEVRRFLEWLAAPEALEP